MLFLVVDVHVDAMRCDVLRKELILISKNCVPRDNLFLKSTVHIKFGIYIFAETCTSFYLKYFIEGIGNY